MGLALALAAAILALALAGAGAKPEDLVRAAFGRSNGRREPVRVPVSSRYNSGVRVDAREPEPEPVRQGALECDGGSKLGTHCVCVQPQLCVGSTCAHSIGDSAQAVSGWNPDHCADCRCSSGNHRP